MSDLLSTPDGVNAVVVAQRYLLERRLSRFFKRNLVISYNDWKSGNGFVLETLVGELNSFHDEEVLDLFRLLALVGGTAATMADMEIFVDPTNGSDTTGDGTETLPYQSLWFLPTLPKRIDHEIDILLLGDVSYPNFAEMLVDHDFGAKGVLNFIGVGTPEIVEGPFEVSFVSALAGIPCVTITMTTAPGAAHAGEFLMATSGTDAGQTQAIHSLPSVDTFLCLKGSFPSLSPGDTMNVVRPSVTLSCRALAVTSRNGSWYSDIVRGESKISFTNLIIDIANTNDARDSLLIDSTCDTAFGFVQIDPPDNGTWRVKSRVNYLSPSSFAESKTDSGVTNISDFGTESNQNFSGVAIKDVGKSYPGWLDRGDIGWWSTRGLLNLIRDCNLRHVSAERIAAERSMGKIYQTIVEGHVNSNVGGGIEVFSSCLDLEQFLVLNSDNYIVLIGQSFLTLTDCNKALYSTISQYGIYFFSGGTCELHFDPSFMGGTLDDVWFGSVNPGIPSAFPSAYNTISQETSVVKRLSA